MTPIPTGFARFIHRSLSWPGIVANAAFLHRFLRNRIAPASVLFIATLSGCGSHSAFTPPPIVLNVSVNSPSVSLSTNGTPVYVSVTIVAPTETATFNITGLPGGVSATYKESESNPSGLLTLIASSAAKPGTSMPMITVGSSGQTASTTFTLVIQAANP